MKKPTFLILALISLFLYGCDKNDNKRNLANTSWEVTTIVFGDAQINAPAAYILHFYQDNSFGIQLDINSCGGEYTESKKNRISFDYINCTEACCDSQFAQDIVEILLVSNSYALNNNQLDIFSAQKSLKLMER
jgi:heat shock protein HslJ